MGVPSLKVPVSMLPIILPPLVPSLSNSLVGVTMAACRRGGIGRSPYLVGFALLFVDEVMLHSEHGGRCAGGDADLGVDVLDVMARGLRRDPEQARDLPVRATARDEA